MAESYRRRIDASGQEVEPSTAGASGGRDLELAEALDILRSRDQLVCGAYAIGMSKMEIFRRTGIARTTIDRILAGE